MFYDYTNKNTEALRCVFLYLSTMLGHKKPSHVTYIVTPMKNTVPQPWSTIGFNKRILHQQNTLLLLQTA